MKARASHEQIITTTTDTIVCPLLLTLTFCAFFFRFFHISLVMQTALTGSIPRHTITTMSTAQCQCTLWHHSTWVTLLHL